VRFNKARLSDRANCVATTNRTTDARMSPNFWLSFGAADFYRGYAREARQHAVRISIGGRRPLRVRLQTTGISQAKTIMGSDEP